MNGAIPPWPPAFGVPRQRSPVLQTVLPMPRSLLPQGCRWKTLFMIFHSPSTFSNVNKSVYRLPFQLSEFKPHGCDRVNEVDAGDPCYLSFQEGPAKNCWCQDPPPAPPRGKLRQPLTVARSFWCTESKGAASARNEARGKQPTFILVHKLVHKTAPNAGFLSRIAVGFPELRC